MKKTMIIGIKSEDKSMKKIKIMEKKLIISLKILDIHILNQYLMSYAETKKNSPRDRRKKC